MPKIIKINDQLLKSIREIVDKTKIFADEEDFINQAIIKQISKFREI